MACSHARNSTHAWLRETIALNAGLGGTLPSLGGDHRQCASTVPHGKGTSIAQRS